jgi:uncharacterized protein (TIGR02147 family)
MDATARYILEEEYLKRKKANPLFSLRQFAKKLDIPSGRLTEIISGKRQISYKVALKIVGGLDLPSHDSQRFLNAVSKQVPQSFIREKENSFVDSRVTHEDTFRAIADWYHFAILSLIETHDFQNNPEWIAKRLGIEAIEARNAYQRLLKLGLLIEKDNKVVLGQGNMSTTHDIESVAIKKSHRQSLNQAIECLDEVTLDLRDITSMTMAIDIKKIPQAKELIKKFRRSLCVLLENSSNRNEVYNLNIQLVPVTKVQSKARKK